MLRAEVRVGSQWARAARGGNVAGGGGLGLMFMSPSMFKEQRTPMLRIQSGKSSRRASVSQSCPSLGLRMSLSQTLLLSADSKASWMPTPQLS